MITLFAPKTAHKIAVFTLVLGMGAFGGCKKDQLSDNAQRLVGNWTVQTINRAGVVSSTPAGTIFLDEDNSGSIELTYTLINGGDTTTITEPSTSLVWEAGPGTLSIGTNTGKSYQFDITEGGTERQVWTRTVVSPSEVFVLVK